MAPLSLFILERKKLIPLVNLFELECTGDYMRLAGGYVLFYRYSLICNR